MKVLVAYADPLRQPVIELDVPEGATLGSVLALPAIPDEARELLRVNVCGVWGRVRPLDYVLREGDRIEVYRPLVADPKTARRKRAAAR